MDIKSRSAVITVYTIVSAVLVMYYCDIPPSPDQSIFDYMSWLNVHGAPHYVGAFDVTWPGQLVVHDIGLALFGVHPWMARLTDFLYLQFGILALWGFSAGAGYARAGIALIFVYPIIYVTSGGWMAGHRDIVAMHLLIGAAALMLRQPRHPFVAGALVGYATATRPTYLFFAAWCVIDDLLHRVRRDRRMFGLGANISAFSAGIAVVAAAFVAAGYAADSLNAWYSQAVRFVIDIYPVGEPRVRLIPLFFKHVISQWNWLAAAAVIGGGVWLLNPRNKKSLSLFVGMTTTAAVSFIVQNKGFPYHLGGLIPLMAISACIGVESAWSVWQRQGISRLRMPLVLAGILVSLILSLGIMLRLKHAILPFVSSGLKGSETYVPKLAERDMMVSIVRKESRIDDSLFQFGWNYDVAFLSERPTPTRYINTPALTLIREEDSEYFVWLKSLKDDLNRRQPRFVLIDRAYWKANETTPVVRILHQFLDGKYSLRAKGNTMDLLERDRSPTRIPKA